MIVIDYEKTYLGKKKKLNTFCDNFNLNFIKKKESIFIN